MKSLIFYEMFFRPGGHDLVPDGEEISRNIYSQCNKFLPSRRVALYVWIRTLGLILGLSNHSSQKLKLIGKSFDASVRSLTLKAVAAVC